jgi:hypothetical protein
VAMAIHRRDGSQDAEEDGLGEHDCGRQELMRRKRLLVREVRIKCQGKGPGLLILISTSLWGLMRYRI